MNYINREIERSLDAAVSRGKSVLLLGPRQTGKTTLLEKINPDVKFSLNFPETRIRYEKAPDAFTRDVEAIATGRKERPLVALDEIQKVPLLMDAIQDLIDRRRALFVLTGSSARKLRRGAHVNLLPGRVVPLRLDPYTLEEMPNRPLRDHLLFGDLPGIVGESVENDRETDLDAYVTAYLEEEVRAEAIVRNLGSFARFLELSASESGQTVNFRKLAQEIGVAHTTVEGYFQVLEDCLISERVEPLTETRVRRRLYKGQKYLFFDLGVRRRAARVGKEIPLDTWGTLFEQFIGLQLIRRSRFQTPHSRVFFWRALDGPEVDWVLQTQNGLIPIEVKWTDSPTLSDARHVELFLREYPQAQRGFILCRTPNPMKISNRVTALPWQRLSDVWS